MMVMPSNHIGPLVRQILKSHPGRIGWLIGPRARGHTKLRAEIPFALDNDAYTCWRDSRAFDLSAWRSHLEWVRDSGFPPLWILVPDVVADKKATIASWNKHHDEAASFGWPMAFAVQNGMIPEDVPSNADVVFVGGTTEWKWRTVPMWVANFPRVHVARVNEEHRLWRCDDLGVESVDGSGWFREGQNGRKARGLMRWINGERYQLEMNHGLP